MSSINKYKTKAGKEFYRVQYVYGYDPITNLPLKTSKRGFKTKTAAKLFAAKQTIDFDRHGYTEQDNIKFRQIYDAFMESYKNTVKESTLNRVEGLFKHHILPLLSNIPIKKINVTKCQNMVNKWSEELVDFRKVANYCGLVFKEARRLSIIYENPMELVIFPKTDPHRHKLADDKFWDKYELNTFLDQLNADFDQTNKEAVALFRLMAFTGCRKAELLALQVADFNYKQKTLLINKTVTRRIDNSQTIGTPKTISGYRTLYLDQDTADILNNWIKAMHRQMLIFGYNTNRNDQWIFPNTKNKLLSLMKPNKWMDHIIDSFNNSQDDEKNKLKRITPHGLRHTWATLAMESKNLTPKQIQKQLGDSDIKIVLDTYTHVTKKATEETIQSYSAYVNS